MTEDNKISTKILWFSLRMLINIALVCFLVEGFVYGYHFSYKLFADIPYKSTSHTTMSVTINEGESATEVAKVLELTGIVENRYLFLGRVYLGKYQERIIAGTYTLGPGMSPEEICMEICGMQSEEES